MKSLPSLSRAGPFLMLSFLEYYPAEIWSVNWLAPTSTLFQPLWNPAKACESLEERWRVEKEVEMLHLAPLRSLLYVLGNNFSSMASKPKDIRQIRTRYLFILKNHVQHFNEENSLQYQNKNFNPIFFQCPWKAVYDNFWPILLKAPCL